MSTKNVLEYTREELEQLSTEELEKLYIEAEQGKDEYNTLQLVNKVLINSLYGALANPGFILFNESIAASITGNGRYFIQKVSNYVEKELQEKFPSSKSYIIYNDTDSFYYQIDSVVKKYKQNNPEISLEEEIDFCDRFSEKFIQPIIDKCVDDFAYELNAYDKSHIGAKKEIIADVAVFCAKKKYYARVRDSEGTRYPLDAPKIKIMGLELAKSTTPKFTQDKLNQAINIILDKSEKDLKDFVKTCKEEFTKVPLTDIAAVGGVSNIDYDLEKDKGIPFGAKAAICFNKYIQENNLTNIYTKIQSGDKTKRLFLRQPNKFGTEIIAFTSNEFAEKELKPYIDYDTNFEKNFMQPLNLMVESLDYRIDQETEVLDDW